MEGVSPVSILSAVRGLSCVKMSCVTTQDHFNVTSRGHVQVCRLNITATFENGSFLHGSSF